MQPTLPKVGEWGGEGGCLRDLFKLFFTIWLDLQALILCWSSFSCKVPYLPVFSSCTGTISKVLVHRHGLLLLRHAMTLLLRLSAVVVGLLVLFVNFWRPLHKEGVEVVHPVRARGKSATLKKFGKKKKKKFLHKNANFKTCNITKLQFSSRQKESWPCFLSRHVSTILDMLVHDQHESKWMRQWNRFWQF